MLLMNPYPAFWRDVQTVEFVSPLVLRRNIRGIKRGDHEVSYILDRAYRVTAVIDGVFWNITVPEGMLTDLASVPWWGRWFAGRVGKHLEAAIVHDFLYIAWQDIDGEVDMDAARLFADRVFLAGMKAAGVGWLRRTVMYSAVRVAGGRLFRSRDEPRYV